jgi:uracil-DNA glycosylase family 4
MRLATLLSARQNHTCGKFVCGKHAVGKPTYQIGKTDHVLVVGEAPAVGGWWLTGRAFYRKSRTGNLTLSLTGRNLNRCLTELGLTIDDVFYVEAVKCRPDIGTSWFPSERIRRKCGVFLQKQIAALKPSLIIPLGVIATRSCLEVLVGVRCYSTTNFVGKPIECTGEWGNSWILPIYHPSPANNHRWPHNIKFLKAFAKRSGRKTAAWITKNC